ncbi:MAG: hypothetical protein LAT68_03155 [Cyclobacteriaceae bacterium]|nr:hypothetical protein [Cyclobacteriaceae bacterium]MCH8515305.1 hypothetical protein [Cyclobacteriaceae bacterium]
MTTLQFQLNDAKLTNELTSAWTNKDYIALLEQFDFPDANTIKAENALEYLKMAIEEEEPNAAAAIVLEYRLGEELNSGQIDQISNDMLVDKVCEEYPEINLHEQLFNVNQLLYKAYNGKFPNAQAIIISGEVKNEGEIDIKDPTNFLKAFAQGLDEGNLIKRLFSDKLNLEADFPTAPYIVWQLDWEDDHKFQMITSEYWINTSDLNQSSFEASL